MTKIAKTYNFMNILIFTDVYHIDRGSPSALVFLKILPQLITMTKNG